MMTDERDDEMIVAWMRQFAALPIEKSSLPDPAYLWWKAQLLRQWDAQRNAVAPLEVGERVQVAMGLAGAAILLALLWSRPTLAASAGLASPNLMITIAAVVLLLTVVFVAGWWRRSPSA